MVACPATDWVRRTAAGLKSKGGIVSETAHQRFVEMVNRPEPEIDLARAALLIAQEERSDLEPESYIDRLDEWGAQLRPQLVHAIAPEHFVSHLNRFLFGELEFRGVSDRHYKPCNSFLDYVMDHRVGIPVTLSVVYIEVARRIGFHVQGVGMPGHFLIKPGSRDSRFYIDPFHQGRILSEDDCERKIEEMYAGALPFQKSFLAPVGRRQILIRMLYNLKSIYVQRENYSKALSVVDKILCLVPEAPVELRDRGILHFRLGQVQEAIIDLQKYLLYSPKARDAAQIRQMILMLQAQNRRETPNA